MMFTTCSAGRSPSQLWTPSKKPQETPNYNRYILYVLYMYMYDKKLKRIRPPSVDAILRLPPKILLKKTTKLPS